MLNMKQKTIYIQAAQQISMQQPMSEQWMEEPMAYDEVFVKAVNPSFRDYMAANEARRMGNLMKRALVTTLKVLKDTGIEHPDAIITGTSLGSLDYTERFLTDMVENDEETLSPTHFMQSTHNTVGSALGIYTKSHGYNTTYSHGSMSFDLTLLDAWMQMQLGKITTALVGGHEEMVESYFELLKKTGYVSAERMVPCSEVAVAMMLNTEKHDENLCEFAGVRVCNVTSVETLKTQIDSLLADNGLTMDDVSAVMTGINGNPKNDDCYAAILEDVFAKKPQLQFKNVFGENFTASAFGVYAAANCLKKNVVPAFMYSEKSPCKCDDLETVLILNQMNGREYSAVLLKRIK